MKPEQPLPPDDSLRERCQTLRDALSELRSTLELLRGRTDGFREKIRGANRERAVAKREISLLRDGIFQVSAVLRGVEARFAHLKPRLAEATSEREALLESRASLAGRLKELRTGHEAARERLDSLRARMDADGAAVALLEPQVAACKARFPSGLDDGQFRSERFLEEAMALLRREEEARREMSLALEENGEIARAKEDLGRRVEEAGRIVEREFACKTFLQRRSELNAVHGRLEEVLVRTESSVEQTWENAAMRRQAIQDIRRSIQELRAVEQGKSQAVAAFLALKEATDMEKFMQEKAQAEAEEARAGLDALLRHHAVLQRRRMLSQKMLAAIRDASGPAPDAAEAM
ncbi:hypothetical protein [Fundidesulfovibrio magnetotacticus]|uniref:hypothetical protein n=1 Tax=Fundidesulfovibrio magnetotacticus TaxID=2730080 RepID=UPI001567C1AC|nr:hypothetical protein [Fundidesulfovibrio magnetotacticus]